MSRPRVVSAAPLPLVRSADPSDAAALVGLLEQLGYACTEEAVASRLELSLPTRRALLAELSGSAVGLAVLELLHPLHRAAPEAVLTALITDANTRHRGVARALIVEASLRARQQGATLLYLRCDRRRDDAHGFYRAQGFEETHLTFERPL
jgi:GNAT superfamily N-acetyltransferase